MNSLLEKLEYFEMSICRQIVFNKSLLILWHGFFITVVSLNV